MSTRQEQVGATDLTTGPGPDERPRADSGLRAKAVRGAVWSIAQIAGNQGASFVVFLILGRILSPRDFGLTASALVVIQAMRVIVDAGFGNALIQLPELGPDDADTAFWTAVAVAVVFCAVTIAIAPLLAILFREPRLTRLVQVLSVIYIFVAFDSTQTALLSRELQFRPQTIRRLIATLFSASLAVGLAIYGAGVWALVLQQVALEGLSVMLLWRLTKWRPRRNFSPASFRKMFTFGWRYSAMRILWYLTGSADNFLIATFMGPVALGYYAIAYRILVIFNNMVVTPVSIVAMPMFARLQGDQDRVNRAFYRVSRISAMIALPVYAGTAVVALPLITFLFGVKWAPSAPVLVVLTLAGITFSQSGFIPSYMAATGRIANELPWLAGTVLVQLIAFGAATPFGIIAVAAALSVVSAVALPTRLYTLRHLTGLSMRLYFSHYLGLLTATGVMAAIVWTERQLLSAMPLPASLFIEVVTGAVVYVIALRLAAPHAFWESLDLVSKVLPTAAAQRLIRWFRRSSSGVAHAAGQPADAIHSFRAALAFEQRDDLAAAEKAYRTADRMGHARAAVKLGLLLQDRGDLPATEEAFRRADGRGDATGAFHLAWLLQERGDPAGAEEAYRRAKLRGHPAAGSNLRMLQAVASLRGRP